MRTFEELRRERILFENQILLNAEENIKQNEKRGNKRYEYYIQVENSKKALENIDEVVRMEIAANANILHQGLRECSEYNTFYEVIKKYLNDASRINELHKKEPLYDVLRHLESLGTFRLCPEDPHEFYGFDIIKAILYFGFTNEDLKSIIDEKIDIRIKDEFLCFINSYYGTNIPLSTEIKELSEHLVAENEIQRKQINCRLSLIHLRNGELMVLNYPSQYEADILRLCENSSLTKKLTLPKNTNNKQGESYE